TGPWSRADGGRRSPPPARPRAPRLAPGRRALSRGAALRGARPRAYLGGQGPPPRRALPRRPPGGRRRGRG
ncbi:MAG: hypothetical protein ACK56I_03120, partial [bacterium]